MAKKIYDWDNDWQNHKIDVLRRLDRMEAVLNDVRKKVNGLCTTVTVMKTQAITIAVIVSVLAGGAAGKFIPLIFR